MCLDVAVAVLGGLHDADDGLDLVSRDQGDITNRKDVLKRSRRGEDRAVLVPDKRMLIGDLKVCVTHDLAGVRVDARAELSSHELARALEA